ncbi:hypothetical protein HY732_00065 [Candidatus Uhrbacteria bacterium]|nr:hypothetical protein [Candidatus Uhrbacteria bacterium]
MKGHTPQDIEALTNWDGLLCKPPWRNAAEKRQYYNRYVTRMLWRYFTPDDWRNVGEIVDTLRVPEKLKLTTKFLAKRHNT